MEEDKMTLSHLYKFLPQRTSPRSGHSARQRQRSTSSVPKRLLRKSCHALEENEENVRERSSLRRNYRKDDFVWAKAFPYTWWPGKIEGFKGRLISVSFFGCNRSRSFKPSEVCDFEESFPQMVKKFGVKLSEEIGLALNDFARVNAMGLKFFCGVSSVNNNVSLAMKSSFNPLEIFGFVIDKAISPQVAVEEIATVDRVSANIIAFRSTLSICKTSEVDQRFCAEALLDFIADIAISPCTVDKEIDGFGKAVTQLKAFRRFASMKTNGFCQRSWDFVNDTLESYNAKAYLGQPDCTSEDKKCQETSRYPEIDVSVEPQEELELLDVNCKHAGRDVCMSNTMDIRFFDMDRKYDQERSADILHPRTEDASVKPEVGAEIQLVSVLPCASNAVQKFNGIPDMASLEGTDLWIPANDSGLLQGILHSRMEDASVKPEVDAEVQHISSLPCATNAVQRSNGISHMALLEETILPIPADDSGKSAGILHSRTENTSVKSEVGAEVQHISRLPCSSNPVQCSNGIPHMGPLGTAQWIPVNSSGKSAGVLYTSAESASLKPEVGAEVRHISSFSRTSNAAQCSNEIPEIAPPENTALHFLANGRGQSAGILHSCMEDAPVKPEVGAEVPHVSASPCTRNVVQCSIEIPQILPLEKTAAQVLTKRKHSETSTVTFKLSQTSPSRAKTISLSGSLIGKDNPAQVNNGNNKDLSPVFSYKLDNSGRSSKLFTTTNQHNHYGESRWQAFYAAPLIKDGLQSTKNRLRSLESNDCSTPKKNCAMKYPKDRNNCVTPKKKLTMKFPRDYILPSKEDLEKKFHVFGPLDHRKTNVFFYTGVGEVVFLHQADAVVAYNYVTRKAIFGQANMRFWLSKTENSKKGNENVSGDVHSSLNTKTCLKKPSTPELVNKRKNYRVRFSTDQ